RQLLGRLFEKEIDVLIRLGYAGAAFFCSRDQELVFADVMLNGRRVTWPVPSREFERWLRGRFWSERETAPSGSAVKNAIKTFEARAAHDGERHDVHLRVAQAGGRIYIDLVDHDWSVVEVDARGWRVIEGAPVRFRRAPGMSALPVPERGGSVEQLRKFVNLTDDGFVLYAAGILDAMRPG